MKKRFLLVALLTFAAACGAAGLAGCKTRAADPSGGTLGEPSHVHSYVTTTVEPKCGAEGYDSHVCECGEHYEDRYTNALKHELQNDKCVNCGKSATAGLNVVGGVLVDLGSAKDEKDILIPSSVCAIGEEAFVNSAAEYVTLPTSVSVIKQRGFWLSKIKSIVLTSITTLKKYAFAACSQLEEIDLCNVEIIEENVFSNCTSLTGVTLPATLTEIGSSLFNYCPLLESVTLDGGNRNFYAAGGCIIERATGRLITAVPSCEIPASGSVTEIADGAFNGAAGIEYFTVPAGVKKVGNGVFEGSDLKHLTIGKDVESISSASLSNLTGGIPPLESITVDKDNAKYYSAGNCLIERATKKLVFGCKNSVIPDDITEIGESAFHWCKGFKGELTVPKSVTKIGGYAFAQTGIRKLTTHITGSEAFSGCLSLTEVIIAEGATKIASTSFRGCNSLMRVTLPSTLTGIETDAFNYCYKLVEICNLSPLSLSAGSTANGKVAQYAKNIGTDKNAATKIEIDENWAYYVDGESVILLGYTGDDSEITLKSLQYKGKTASLDANVFAGLDVDSLTVNGINSFNANMFRYATRITNLIINASAETEFANRVFVRSIYDNITINGAEDVGGAFYDSKAKCVTLNGVKALNGNGDYYAFAFSENLEKIVLGEGLTEIGAYALYGCTKLSEVVLPATLKTIGDGAFYQDAALKSVTLPASLEKLGSFAFFDCGLKSLALPASVNEVGAYIVWNCPIESMNLPDGSWKVYLEREGETAGWYDAEFTFENVTEGLADGVWNKK